MEMTDAIQIVTTAESRDRATTIARELVERRLAACAQVQGPIHSIFWWQGKIDESEEWLCVAKTTGDKYEEVAASIRDLHTYDVPEIMAFPMVAGSEDYLDWLRREIE